MALVNSWLTTWLCSEDLGVMEHGKGKGLELKPSEKAKLGCQSAGHGNDV